MKKGKKRVGMKLASRRMVSTDTMKRVVQGIKLSEREMRVIEDVWLAARFGCEEIYSADEVRLVDLRWLVYKRRVEAGGKNFLKNKQALENFEVSRGLDVNTEGVLQGL